MSHLNKRCKIKSKLYLFEKCDLVKFLDPKITSMGSQNSQDYILNGFVSHTDFFIQAGFV